MKIYILRDKDDFIWDCFADKEQAESAACRDGDYVTEYEVVEKY